MQTIKTKLPDTRQLRLEVDRGSGETEVCIFDIQASDIDIMERANELKDACTRPDPGDLAGVTKAIRAIIDYIDEVLGDGAVNRITNGRSVSMMYGIQLMLDICGAVVQEYNEKLIDEYK